MNFLVFVPYSPGCRLDGFLSRASSDTGKVRMLRFAEWLEDLEERFLRHRFNRVCSVLCGFTIWVQDRAI